MSRLFVQFVWSSWAIDEKICDSHVVTNKTFFLYRAVLADR